MIASYLGSSTTFLYEMFETLTPIVSKNATVLYPIPTGYDLFSTNSFTNSKSDLQ